MIAIINYGSGNIGAIENIYKRLKVPYIVSENLKELESVDKYILPGVGAFDVTMNYFNKSGLTEVLTEQVTQHNKKVLGICVGMQIFADSSDEGARPGLGWIAGHVRKIDFSKSSSKLKVPHMGWNSVIPAYKQKLFDNIDISKGFYFLHSYYFDALDDKDVAAVVEYETKFPCAVTRNNIIGVQFHPEKSHVNGVEIFRNFASL